MIINISRTKALQTCERYAYNWDELRLYPLREADPLVMGEGYHLGSEVITRTADIGEAMNATEHRMRERYKGQMILLEERELIERNVLWAKNAVKAWAEHYDRADFRVLWPEVSGCVELPGTHHHCWYAHRLLFPDIPFEQCQFHLHHEDDRDGVMIAWDPSKPCCWQPHYFAFRTDGVIEMYKHIWLLEQKTTSSTNRNHFWQKFILDNQIRGYVYGVWRATGVLTDGAMVNAIIKHSKVKTEMGVKSYELDPTNVGFERDHVLIGKRDVEDFERELILLANRYEHIMSHPDQIVKNPKSCFDWNRQCYYWDRCKRFNEEFEGEFKQRTPDYVEQHYIKILDIPTEKSEVTPCQSHPTQQDPGAMNATNSGPKITPTAQTAATSYDPPTNESK